MAVTAADIVLMSDNLLMIPATIELCRYAKYAMFENITFAITVKVVAIALAFLGTYLYILT